MKILLFSIAAETSQFYCLLTWIILGMSTDR